MALLWFSRTESTSRQFYHAGGGLGSMAYCVLDPAQQIGVVVLANVADTKLEPALQAVATRLLQAAGVR